MVALPQYNGYNSDLSANDTAYVRKRSHHIRRIMFPDIEPDLPDEQDEPIPSGSSLSIIEMMAQPLADTKNAVVDLLHVQDDAEAAYRALPEWIQHLSHKDPSTVAYAAQMINGLTRHKQFIQQLANDQALINALVEALGRTKDERVHNAIMATLAKLSTREGCVSIFKSGGIPELVRMLRSPIRKTKQYAITTLHNLIKHVENSRPEVIACGGVEAFTPLLQEPDERVQALVADSLFYLLAEREQCQAPFLSLQGPHMLLFILAATKYERLIYAVVRVIRVIAAFPENKQALIEFGAFEELHHSMLKVQGPDFVPNNFIKAMLRLSDSAANLNTLTGLIVDLLKLLGHYNDTEILSWICGILSNLTCNNVVNKLTVCDPKNRGIQILAHTLHDYAYIEDITEPVLCTMRHCTIRHPAVVDAIDQVRTAGAFPSIMSLLATRRKPIVKAALGLVRNCSVSEINRKALIMETTTHGDTIASIAIEVLFESGQRNLDDIEDGVMTLESLEGAVGALKQLSKDPNIAREVYTHNGVISVLFNLLANERITRAEDELFMRELLGLIYCLTSTPSGVQAFESYDQLPRYIEPTLSSEFRAVRVYASMILKNMGLNDAINARRPGRTPTRGVDNRFQQHTNPAYNGDGWVDGLEPDEFNELYNYASVGDLHLDTLRNSNHGRQQNGHHAHSNSNAWYDTDL
uniref:Armadillo segment polarity protein n=1 Tax=Panagrellus redivivus TaxID=6233 RepID=A0A7E4ZVV8_PANRE